MFEQGFVTLLRKFKDWEWYTDANTMRVFIHLLLSASHQDVRYRGDVIKRGQLITGRKALANELNLSEQQVRTALNNLTKTGEITNQPTSTHSLITLVKYDFYQSKDNRATNGSTNHQPANNQPSTNEKENSDCMSSELEIQPANNQQINQQTASANLAIPTVSSHNEFSINQLSNQQLTNEQPTGNQRVTTYNNITTKQNNKNLIKSYPQTHALSNKEEFEIYRSTYPALKRGGKLESALRAWDDAIASGATGSEIIAGLVAIKNSPDGKYLPGWVKFLADRVWEGAAKQASGLGPVPRKCDRCKTATDLALGKSMCKPCDDAYSAEQGEKAKVELESVLAQKRGKVNVDQKINSETQKPKIFDAKALMLDAINAAKRNSNAKAGTSGKTSINARGYTSA